MTIARISAPLVGEIFQERYRIVSEIGAGGFGTVYKGEQLATGQAVAIKMLRLVGARDPKAIEKRIARLEREMRLCAQLHHPNIVGLIDFGRTSDGGVYSVFEFVPGRNLEEVLLEEGALDPREARHLMLEVLDALSCAHGQGVIHRDLKPSNIMVTSMSARRNALVLDFGIGALMADAHGNDPSRLTATNEVVGTIAYASPEQLLSRPTSPASDLYSWGLVFLECLMGQPAIQASSLMDMLLKQVGAEILMPGALERHELGRILRTAVSKRGEERAASASAIMKRLEACDVADLRSEEMKRPDDPSPTSLDAPSAAGQDAPPALSQAGVTMQVAVPPREGQRSPAGAPRIVEVAPAPPERRQVTVVCVTFCAAGAEIEADFEAADDLLRRGTERCANIAARAGGRPAGGLGDQILFRFGFPAAGEDDARRAARAAREMITTIDREAAELDAGAKSHLRLRIAIHTGLTIAHAPGASAAFEPTASLGVTPQIAARLSTSAAIGEVLASASTQRLLRNDFSFEARGARDLGLAGPVETYRVGLPLSATRAVTVAEGRTPPLVGRERELQLLVQRWADVEGGHGQVVLVTGEAGIGKSRLLRELAIRLRDTPHRWIESRSAPEDQNRALHPVIDILERLLDLGEGDLASSRRGKLESFLRRLDFDLADAMSLISELLGIPPDADPERALQPPAPRAERSPQQAKELLLNALLSLFFELSEREPLVLVVEDVQWADPTTLELFTLIVQEAASSRVLVIFSARPSFVPPWSLSRVLQIQLSRLRREEIREMVAQLAGTSEPPPSGVLAQIVDRTDGVPLFVEELTRMLLESGLLPEPGAPRARMSSTTEVPASLRDLLTARLDRLGRAKGTAQIAAALGREIGHELLAAVSPLGEVQLREDLDALVVADLVQRKRRSRGHTYVFKHALVRDTAYESMLRGARQKVHGDIARAIEERFPDMIATRPDLVALHCAEAGRKHDGVRHVLRAAEVSLHRAAFAEAMGYAQQGLAWLESTEQGRARSELELHLHSVQVNAIFSLKGPGAVEADASIARVEALLDEVTDSPVAIPMLARLALRAQLRASFAQSTELASRCLALAEQTRDSGAQISALAILSQNLFSSGRHADARAAAERALALYDPRVHAGAAIATAGLDFSALCHGVLGFTLWYLGYPDQALAEVKRGLERIERLDHPNSTAMSLLYLGSVHRYRREIGEMTAAMGRMQEISQRHGLYLGAFAGILFTSLAGDVETPKQILAAFRSFGQMFAMPYWSSIVAEAEAATGQRGAALADIEECIRDAESTGELNYLPELLRLQGTFLMQAQAPQGESPEHGLSTVAPPPSLDRETAEACFRRALTLAREQGSRMCELRAAVAFAPLLAATGRRPEAQTLLQTALAAITEGAELPDLSEARALLHQLGGPPS